MPLRFAVALIAVALLLPAAARAGQPPAADLDAPAFVAMLQQPRRPGARGRLRGRRRDAGRRPAAGLDRAGRGGAPDRARGADRRRADGRVDSGVVVAARSAPQPSRGSTRCARRRRRWPASVRRGRICAARWPTCWRRRSSAAGSATPACWRSSIASSAGCAAGCRMPGRAPPRWCHSSATRPGRSPRSPSCCWRG